MKYSIYILASLLLASSVLLRAFYLRPNFWSASILLSQSNGSILILMNLALICTGGTVYLLQRFFYGRLRPIEVEQLYERGWVAVTETALALTIFREDVKARFFVMFLSLMIGKIWAWIGEGRIEHIEQQPSTSRLPTIRLAASLTVSLAFDIFMLSYCLETLAREPKPGMWVMYAFEFVILLTQSTSLFLRFALDMAELVIIHRQTQSRIQSRREELAAERREASPQGESADGSSTSLPDDIDEMEIDVPGWEDKGRWMFYLDLMTDFIKSFVYCGFFMVLLVFHGLPLHIMRDLYITVRSFVKRITDFIQYRNATRDMNARYPDATPDELQADNTCIICREEMIPWNQSQPAGQQAARSRIEERQRPKKLPCGHILHFGCLRSWLERQRVCPTCRRSVLTQESPAGGSNAPPVNNGGEARNNGEPRLPGNQQQAVPRGAQGPNPFRVVNLGPLRVAFGRTQGAGGVQGLLQQMANAQQPADEADRRQPPATQHPGNDILPSLNNPLVIQQQILQLQLQVSQLMQRLQGEHLQLDVLERLVAELVRLQPEQYAASTYIQPSRHDATSSPAPWPVSHPSHTSSSSRMPGEVSLELPSGMILPPGFSLQRLRLLDRSQEPPGQGTRSVESDSTSISPANRGLSPDAEQSTPQPASVENT